MGMKLSVRGMVLVSIFSTGEALQLPAAVDIPAYPVRVVNGMIEVGIPRI